MDCSNQNILCWNVRGLNDKVWRVAVCEMVIASRASIVCLQETKISDFDAFLVAQCMGPRLDGFAFPPANGTRGGILIA